MGSLINETDVLFPQLVKFNKLKISQAFVLQGATCENWPIVKAESLQINVGRHITR